MDMIRALHRLAVLASFRTPPEDLARALCVQVLREFEVSFVHILRLVARGQWTPVACFGAGEDLALFSADEGHRALDALGLLGGRPRACAWNDLAEHLGAGIDPPLAEHVICLPLMHRGLLMGSVVIGMDIDPRPEQYCDFWDTIAIGCAALMALPRRGPTTPAPRAALSPRQGRILELVAEGLTNLQIGHRLGYSESTIGHDLVLAYERLGVRNREDAVEAFRQLHGHDHRLSSGAVA